MLNNDVKETITEAQGLLRSALHKMARQERPSTLNHLTKIIVDLDKLVEFDSILDSVDSLMDKVNDNDDE